MKNICVIIPSLNPDKRLETVVKNLQNEGFENIVLVDDGSLPENKAFFPKSSSIVLLEHEKNLGKGAALKTAMKYVSENRKDIVGVVTCDGDGQHTSHDTKRVAEELIKTNKLVLGVRDFSLENVPARSRIGNRLSSFALLICSGKYISDTQTGLRGIPACMFDAMLKVKGDRFEYETNVLLELGAMKAEYTEVKIDTVYLDENKSSHFRPFHDTVKIFAQMIKYLLSSAASSLTDIFAFFILHGSVGLEILPSTVIARLISSALNFSLNKKVVFKSSSPVIISLLKYYAAAIPTMLVLAFGTQGISSLLSVLQNSFYVTLVKILVDTVLFFVNYKIQKKWIFGKG